MVYIFRKITLTDVFQEKSLDRSPLVIGRTASLVSHNFPNLCAEKHSSTKKEENGKSAKPLTSEQ